MPSTSSLFAADYSVSSTSTSPSLSPQPTSPAPTRGGGMSKPMEVVFPATNIRPTLTTPPRSPFRPNDEDTFTARPSLVARKKSSALSRDSGVTEIREVRGKESSSSGYLTYESCMEGAMGHELKSSTYAVGTEKAYHHLTRSEGLFTRALALKGSSPKAMLGRSKVLISLAMTYQPPRTAITSLRESTKLLRQLMSITPKSISAREALAQACGLLSNILLETDDSADEENKIWEGPIGGLAREALQHLEDVAGDKMDSMRLMNPQDSSSQSPSMAETFLSLSAAAITVSTLATDLDTVELHIELAEQALDQASNMATVAAAARVKSSTSSANLITRVQLASNRSSLERLRHTFILGVDLDEDDFRSLMADMTMLAKECRERAVKLKGAKAAAASTLAFEAVKQLGDAKVLYASLLRLVWRKRKPTSRSTQQQSSIQHNNKRSNSARTDSSISTISEENEDPVTIERAMINSFKSPLPSPLPRPPTSRSGSTALDKIPDEEEITFSTDYSIRRPTLSVPLTIPTTGRRGSWLPTDGSPTRIRRVSSMSAPLIGPDGVSAWTRKASVICLTNEEPKGSIPSRQLAESSWQLLEAAIKQYKLALSVLSTSDLPTVQLARSKTETLTGIASASMFMASLAQRVPLAMEKRTSLLVTAEVYSTWAAREVGWSFLIEGTQEAALADRRTNSWRADEAGKKAVMWLVRIWWHRAVTSESIDVDTKMGAKDAVERVVRRMKDKEGVRDGDVVRFKFMLGKAEGEMDSSEVLFWKSVSRILRGGAGFVMA